MGRSCAENAKIFWKVLDSKLQQSYENLLETLVLKQCVIENDSIDSIASSITNITNVKLINNDMNKRQWAKFAVELNKSESGFCGQHLEQKGLHHVKVHEKLCQKMVLEVMYIFVGSHLCLWRDVF